MTAGFQKATLQGCGFEAMAASAAQLSCWGLGSDWMTSHEELARFISASFRSVWSLELLLLLKRQPGFQTRNELIGRLRGSELVVAQALDGLVAGGLAALDEAGRAAYMPVSTELHDQIERVEDLYARKPDAVRRLIVAASAPGLTAFADAFRLRND